MTTQAGSFLVPSDLDLGNLVAYYCDTPFTTFSSAKSSTAWRKLGKCKGNVDINHSLEKVEFPSGFPQIVEKRYFSKESLSITGEIMELTPRALARVLGGATITETVKSSSPAATTVATGSTKTVVNLASASGYAADDEIRVGNSGSYQYGRIKSISGNAATLYEGLSGDTNPTTGHAVAKIDTTSFDMGAIATPADIALRLDKTLVGGYGTWSLYIIKANFDANFTMSFSDGEGNDGIGVPFNIEALADPAAESGKVAQWFWTQT